MIDIRKLKELVKLMVANDLTELDLRDTEEQVTLRRPSPHDTSAAPTVAYAPAPPAPPSANNAPAAGQDTGQTATSSASSSAADDAITIDSPMVGTFYSKPNPDAESFVKVGDHVDEDTVVCLIEAMKIFNEIKAECSGTVRRMRVESGDPVEFGQTLFEIAPD